MIRDWSISLSRKNESAISQDNETIDEKTTNVVSGVVPLSHPPLWSKQTKCLRAQNEVKHLEKTHNTRSVLFDLHRLTLDKSVLTWYEKETISVLTTLHLLVTNESTHVGSRDVCECSKLCLLACCSRKVNGTQTNVRRWKHETVAYHRLHDYLD